MNFTFMWSVKSHSDLFFWEVAIPVMLVVIPLFMWGDIQRLAHYIDKRWKRRRINKVRLVFRSFLGTKCEIILVGVWAGLGRWDNMLSFDFGCVLCD